VCLPISDVAVARDRALLPSMPSTADQFEVVKTHQLSTICNGSITSRALLYRLARGVYGAERVHKDRKENVVLVSLISSKSLVAASLFLTGGLGTVAVMHADAHARTEATIVTARTSQSTNSNQGSSTSNTLGSSTSSTHGASGTTNVPINQGLTSGASVHGLCVAYKAHVMAGGGASTNVMTRLAHAKAFVELAELATAKGETVAALCAAQGGVSITATPTSSQANATAHNSVNGHNPVIIFDNTSAASVALKNRP